MNWISVKDRMPDKPQDSLPEWYFVAYFSKHSKPRMYGITLYMWTKEFTPPKGGNGIIPEDSYEITHWMKIPLLPNKNEE